jgi:hypothetical protein
VNTTNTRYQIKTWKTLGYDTSSQLETLNGTPSTNFDLISFLDDDIKFSTYVQGQFEYIRVKAVMIRYIPGQPNDVNPNDIGTFVCGAVFGRPSTASWSVEDIDQVKNSVIFNSSRPFTRKYLNVDKNFYTASELTGTMRPHLRFAINSLIKPLYANTRLGILQFQIEVEAKGRYY